MKDCRWLNISQEVFRFGNSYRLWYACQVVSVGVMRSGGEGVKDKSWDRGEAEEFLP